MADDHNKMVWVYVDINHHVGRQRFRRPLLHRPLMIRGQHRSGWPTSSLGERTARAGIEAWQAPKRYGCRRLVLRVKPLRAVY